VSELLARLHVNENEEVSKFDHVMELLPPDQQSMFTFWDWVNEKDVKLLADGVVLFDLTIMNQMVSKCSLP